MPVKKPSNRLFRQDVTIRHWEKLLASGETLHLYCWRNGVYRSPLILSFIKHLPQLWEQHKDKLGPIDEGKCENCGRQFYRNIGKQRFCTYGCNSQARMANPVKAEKNRAKVAKWRARIKEERLARKALESGDGTENPQR